MENYLSHKRRVLRDGERKSLILNKGTPCKVDEYGEPFGEGCDVLDENG